MLYELGVTNVFPSRSHHGEFRDQSFESFLLKTIQTVCQKTFSGSMLDTSDALKIRSLLPQFNNRQQHDSQEFLSELLDCIDKALEKEKQQSVVKQCLDYTILSRIRGENYKSNTKTQERLLCLPIAKSLFEAYYNYSQKEIG